MIERGRRWVSSVLLPLAVVCVGGCLGNNGGTGGSAGSSMCLPCGDGPNCFNCGSGCTCADASVLGDAGVWVPPFRSRLVGDDGTWRGDTAAFCPGDQSVGNGDLWSDERGVYVMLTGEQSFLRGVLAEKEAKIVIPADAGLGAAPPPEDQAGAGGAGFGGFGGSAGFGGTGGVAANGNAIFFNDGQSGWQPVATVGAAVLGGAPPRLSGIPAGPLVVHGESFFPGVPTSCALGLVNDDAFACARSEGRVPAFFAVSSTLAYAALDQTLLVFDGAAWSAFPVDAPGAIAALWADDTTVVAVGGSSIMKLDVADATWTVDSSGGTELSAVWGRAPDDLWVGSYFGELMHHDGTQTVLVAHDTIGGCGTSAIVGLWGADDTLYYYSAFGVRRRVGEQDEVIGNWCNRPEIHLERVWGNALDEVFFLFSDSQRRFIDACGGEIVMFFDGALFHRL